MKIYLDRHFYLLGLISLCLVQPMISQTQRPGSHFYSSYIRHSVCRATDPIRYPRTVDDIVGIVNEAIRRGVKVKAFGQRHSITDIICTDGIPVDMRSFKSLKMNADETGTFGAGVTIQEAGDFLLQHKRALKVLPAYGNITIGGAIGTGAHGSSIKFHSSLSAQVAKMTVVNGLGKVVVISSREDLRSFKVHLGLLGVVVDVTLNTVPLYKVKSQTFVASDDVLTNGEAINWAKTSDQLTLYWFPSIAEVVVSNMSVVPAETAGNVKLFMSTTFESNVLNTIYKESAFNLSASDCTAASSLGKTMLHFLDMRFRTQLSPDLNGERQRPTDDNETSSAVGYPHDLLTAVCDENCPWSHPKPYSIETLDSEFDFALDDMPEVVRTVKDIVVKTSTAFPSYGIILRFSNDSDIYMSTSYKRPSCHFEFQLWKRTDAYNEASGNLAGYQTILQALSKRYNARSHWGKSGLVYHSSEMLEKKLNSFARQRFIAAMQKYDPNGIFLNSFGRRLMHKDTAIDIDPLTTRCALLDNCFCSVNNGSDCGDQQICTTISGYNYPVCETKNVVATQFERGEFPAAFDVGHWFFNSFSPLVRSLSC